MQYVSYDFTSSFQSTPLMRGETRRRGECVPPFLIFQSTPLMRGETCQILIHSCYHIISIHSPHARGDDSHFVPVGIVAANFNPLPSCEGRPLWPDVLYGPVYFNPLPSCEGRQRHFDFLGGFKRFQSTPLMRGETSFCRNLLDLFNHFNPLPSCEGRQGN